MSASKADAVSVAPSPQKSDVWAVIPTLNEAATVRAVVESARLFCAVVLVVDGGSHDSTQDEARTAGARVEVLHARGKGRALRHAARLVEAPFVVFLDADGSHDARDIPALLAPLRAGRVDLVVGSRWTGGSDELHGDMNKWLRRSGSRVLTTLVNLRWGARLSDIQNGFRAARTPLVCGIGLTADDFTIEQEMVMKFLAGGFRVLNVPSHEYARRGGTAKLNLGRVWFHFGIVVLRHLCGLSRPALRHRSTSKNPPK